MARLRIESSIMPTQRPTNDLLLMRILQLRNEGPALSQEDIKAFEDEIGARLPVDYKWFLLRKNGGVASRTTLSYTKGSFQFQIHLFYELTSDLSIGLRRSLADFSLINKSYLPIAGEADGYEICVPIVMGKRGVCRVRSAKHSLASEQSEVATVHV